MEVSLKDIIRLLLERVWLIILLAMTIGMASGLYTHLKSTPVYTADVIIYFKDVSSNDIDNIVAILDHSDFRTKLITYDTSNVSRNLTNEEYRRFYNQITISKEGASGRIIVKFRLGNRQDLLRLINVFKTESTNTIREINSNATVNFIGGEQMDINEIRSNPLRNAIVYSALFLIVYVIAEVFLMLVRKPIKSEDYFKLMDIKYLGGIDRIRGYYRNQRYYLNKDNYRAIRTNINCILANSDENNPCIMFAAQSHGSADTTIVGIVKSMSSINKKVLLIDMDMRNGTMTNYLKRNNTTGLSEVLKKDKTMSEVIIKTEDGYDFICAGGYLNDYLEKVDKTEFKAMLDELRSQYDCVFLSPSKDNLFIDLAEISPLTYGVIVITSYGSTTLNQFTSIVDSVKFANGNILGAVIDDKVYMGLNKKFRI